VKFWGGGVSWCACGEGEKTPQKAFGKFEHFCWPEPHSARLGLTLDMQAKQTHLSVNPIFGDLGCSEWRVWENT
jgi:hypothetical protein